MAFSWLSECYGEFADVYGNASTDNEAIAAAAAFVSDGDSPRIHVRADGRYLAEVRLGYQGTVVIEKHDEDGTVHEFELPCLMRLVSHWLNWVEVLPVTREVQP